MTLEEENKALATAMSTFAKEIEKLRSLLKANVRLNTAVVFLRFLKILFQIEPRLARSSSTPEAPRSHTATPERSRTPVSDLTSTAILTPSSSASDMGYGPKVSLNDPTWKVLPAALKKHGNMDDPKEYVMFISYDSPGSEHLIFRLIVFFVDCASKVFVRSEGLDSKKSRSIYSRN